MGWGYGSKQRWRGEEKSRQPKVQSVYHVLPAECCRGLSAHGLETQRLGDPGLQTAINGNLCQRSARLLAQQISRWQRGQTGRSHSAGMLMPQVVQELAPFSSPLTLPRQTLLTR